jgi:hypothetical protein
MTKQEVLDILRPLGANREMEWMIDLGAALTVSARGGYAAQDQAESANQLIGFNELQHQIYGRIRQLRCDEIWTLDSFLDGLMQRARHYKIEGDFGWALKTSIARLQ